jgi:ABC-2 type transport system permease protein
VAGFLLFGLAALHVNVLSLMVMAGLVFLLALSCGILAAAVQVWIQKGGAVVWLFGSVVWLFSGTMFPVSVLPLPLQKVSEAIPLTHALDGVRMALLKGTPLSAMAGTLGVLVSLAAVLVPVAAITFSLTLRHARRTGTLSYY